MQWNKTLNSLFVHNLELWGAVCWNCSAPCSPARGSASHASLSLPPQTIRLRLWGRAVGHRAMSITSPAGRNRVTCIAGWPQACRIGVADAVILILVVVFINVRQSWIITAHLLEVCRNPENKCVRRANFLGAFKEYTMAKLNQKLFSLESAVKCSNAELEAQLRDSGGEISGGACKVYTWFQCDPSCSKTTFPDLSSGKFKG